MTTAAESAVGGTVPSGRPFQMRFIAIWLAFIVLILLSAAIAPRSLLPSTFLAIVPLAAFLTITAAGESLVLMSRSIDLSIPSIITLSSTILLGFSRGRDEDLLVAIAAALAFAVAVGLVNGILVAVLKLNALIVTLAVGAIVSGMTLWYRESLPAESRVPVALADWGGSRILGLNVSVWVAAIAVALLTLGLRKSTIGRRFAAVGANPRSAWVVGINVPIYQIAAFGVAGLLYGIAGILLSAFIRNPTLGVGDPYLLSPIAAAVLGGTAISGGIGSMVAVAGAAIFLTHLGQVLKMLGLSTAFQFVIYGLAIALGMALAESRIARLRAFRQSLGSLRLVPRLRRRTVGIALTVIGLGALILWSRSTAVSWDDWLLRYQVLIAGLLLLGGAALISAAIGRQAAGAQAAAHESRRQAASAARALLPSAIDALGNYTYDCTRALMGLLPENGLQQKVSRRLAGDLRFPYSVLPSFQTAIVSSDAVNAAKLADLLAALQVQHARLRPLEIDDPGEPLWRAEVLHRIIDAAEIRAGATAVLDYARGIRAEIDLDPSPEDIRAALRNCGIVGNWDLEPLVANWTSARSIYRSSEAPD